MTETIKIMLVDDQLLFLESLKMVIENLDEGISIVSTACDGEEALRNLERIVPDIVLMDVRMPGMDGVCAAGLIKKKYPGVRVIMLTTFEDDEYVKEALRNGAVGDMLKNIPPQMLVSAIRAVYDGSVLIAPDIAGHLIESLYGTGDAAEKELGTKLPEWYRELTPKEKTILKYIVNGLTNKEISSRIHIGEQTVRNYISSIYAKLDVHHRKGAIEKARSIDRFFLD